MSKLGLKTEGDAHVIVTRRFAAPPEAVYRAHTDPQLIQKWLLGPEGWTMPVCINAAKPGGKIRYDWTDNNGHGLYLTGEYQNRSCRADAPARANTLELEPYRRSPVIRDDELHDVLSSVCNCSCNFHLKPLDTLARIV